MSGLELTPRSDRVSGSAKGPSHVDISIVAPLYNEAGNVEHLVARLHALLRRIGFSYEIILVDDGSRDETWPAIIGEVKAAETQAPAGTNGAVIGCRLSRNFGHQAALLAGLRTSQGRAVVTMDGDLQHPPEVIPELIEQWRAGFAIVNTRRLDEAETSAFKRLSSRYFYRLFSLLAEVELSEGSSDFRLIDRQVLDEILRLHENSLFLRGTIEWVGFHKTVIPFRVAERFSGHSKYGLSRMLKFAASAIISHSTVPLRISIWLGVLTSMLACIEIVYVLYATASGWTVPGWASILAIQSFFFGVLFILMGIIGRYLAEIYRMLQSRPNFIIADVIRS